MSEPEKFIPNETVVALCQFLAEQAYLNHILVKRLVEAELFQEGELQRLYQTADPQERDAFFQDFLAYLASIGLKSQ